jgi:STE24 endopeptidase
MKTSMNSYKRIKADPARWFSPEEVQKARTYQRPLTFARALSLAVNLGAILAIISTHTTPRLVRGMGIESWALQLIIIIALFTVVFSVIELPISIWHTFSHEKKWGFSTQTPGGFVADQFKGLALGLAIQLPLFLALWWLIRKTDLWWIAGWGVFFVFSVLLAFLYPILIAPIFNKFTPLEDESLAIRLKSLAEGVGMRVKAIQVMDASKRTRKDNAYFAGFGPSRQIVVFDNLLEQSAGVVASVVAHELGHWRRKHIVKGAVLGAITSLVLFGVLRLVSTWQTALDWAGVSSVREPAAFPLFILVFAVTSSVVGIIGAWISRAHERQADLDALEITDDYDSFIETEHGLSTKNLMDLAPPWWRYIRASHPAPAERLELAEIWRGDRQPKAAAAPTAKRTTRKSAQRKPAKPKAKPKAAKAKPKAAAKTTAKRKAARKGSPRT